MQIGNLWGCYTIIWVGNDHYQYILQQLTLSNVLAISINEISERTIHTSNSFRPCNNIFSSISLGCNSWQQYLQKKIHIFQILYKFLILHCSSRQHLFDKPFISDQQKLEIICTVVDLQMLWVSLHKWKERRIPNQRGKNFYYSNFLMSNLPTYYIDGKIHASNKNKVWTQKNVNQIVVYSLFLYEEIFCKNRDIQRQYYLGFRCMLKITLAFFKR